MTPSRLFSIKTQCGALIQAGKLMESEKGDFRFTFCPIVCGWCGKPHGTELVRSITPPFEVEVPPTGEDRGR